MSLLAEYVREFGRFQRNARLYLVSNALVGISTGILLVLYNLYLVSLGYGTDFIGLVLFMGTIGAGVAIFPAGICVDRFGGKIVLILNYLTFGVAGAGQILFRQPLPLLASGFVAGVITAFALVVNAPFLTANSTAEERSHLFSLNIVLQLGTTVLGEVLGGALPVWFRTIPQLMAPLPAQLGWLLASQHEPRSYQLALLFAGLLAVPSLVPLFLLSDDRPASVLPQPTSFVQNIFVRLSTWRREVQLQKVLFSPFFTLLLVQILVGLGAGLFIPYFNVYFVQHLKASSALFGVIDGGANAMNAVLTLVAPWLAMRIGKVKTVTVTRLLGIPLLLAIGLTNLLPLAAILYLFRQGTTDMAMGVFQVYSMEAVPPQRRGLANSSYQAGMQVAWAATTPLGGLLIARMGYLPVFIGGAILYMLAIGVLWVRFGRGREEPENGDRTDGKETAEVTRG